MKFKFSNPFRANRTTSPPIAQEDSAAPSFSALKHEPQDSAALSYSRFKHESLDHTKASIRLLQVLPNYSDAGLIQCLIWHETVDATYDCLSYVWGSDENLVDILINGKIFSVRKNLRGFLSVAQTKYPSPQRTFWIDALCIDQSCTKERNHQVAQMGKIYSKAIEVIAWFGFDEHIEHAFRFWLELDALNPQTPAEAWAIWEQRNVESGDNQLRWYWDVVLQHEYWTRAWITQEILLARKFKVLVNQFEVEPARYSAPRLLLPALAVDVSSVARRYALRPGKRVFDTYIEAVCGRSIIRNKRLIDLLHSLPKRESHVPRDRIYSLLSVASDAATIPVDYGSSDDDFMLHIFGFFKESMCLCLCYYIANALECQISSGSEDGSRGKMPVLRIPMRVVDIPVPSSGSHGKISAAFFCSACGSEFLTAEHEGIFLCGAHLCERSSWMHLFLFKDNTSEGERYTVKGPLSKTRFEVAYIRNGNAAVTNPDRNLPASPLLDVYLSLGTLIKIFQGPDAKHIQLCSKALEGRGCLASDQNFSVDVDETS